MQLDSVNSVSETENNAFWAVVREAFVGSTRDFTKGSIGVAIFILSVPMIIEMFAESLFALFDIFFVAHLGADAVAVVGLTESMMALVYAVAFGLAIGATATVARRIGEKDLDGAAKTATHVLYLGVIVSIAMSIPGIILAPAILRILGAEPQVIEAGVTFMRIMLGCNAAVVFIFLLNAIFRGAGDAAIAMRVLWFANVLNIILAPCFIFGVAFFPQLGVTGAAVGTTLGRSAGVLYALWFLFRGEKRFEIHRDHWKLDPELLVRIVKLSATAVFQFLIGTASWSVLVRAVAGFGGVAIAGYVIGLRVIVFALLPALGLSNAAATLVGQNLGAGKPGRAERSVWTASIVNAVIYGAIGLVFVFLAVPIVKIFTQDPEITGYAVSCLRIVSYGFLFYGFGMVLESAFNGAGDTWTPTYINLCLFWLFEIPLAYVLAYVFDLGPQGVFWAIMIAFSALAVVSALLFSRGKWKLKKV
ncbi:MAG TPA: MATE family efflux transporter [Pyrinomonadaceae bacterium]|nr:MATE family efflux transporter [Pyrinomonadaceae bacterium]